MFIPKQTRQHVKVFNEQFFLFFCELKKIHLKDEDNSSPNRKIQSHNVAGGQHK